MKGNDEQRQVFVVEQLTVKQDRIVCDLIIEQESYRQTTSALIAHLIQDFPDIARHTCKNAKGTIFAAVMEHTSTPHLLEHLVIDLQAKAASNPSHIYVGTSEWLDERAGRARIEVSFTDDLSALRAFRDAISIVNKAMI